MSGLRHNRLTLPSIILVAGLVRQTSPPCESSNRPCSAHRTASSDVLPGQMFSHGAMFFVFFMTQEGGTDFQATGGGSAEPHPEDGGAVDHLGSTLREPSQHRVFLLVTVRA